MTDAICTREGCDRPVAVLKRGLCAPHYQLARKAGEFGPISEETCRMPHCVDTVTVRKRGLCQRHYNSERAAGNLGEMTERHELTDIDMDAQIAHCSTCDAVVPIMTRVSGQYAVCKLATKAARRRMLFKRELSDVAALLEAAGDACEICREPLTMDTLCLDHDHSCCPGKFTCGECLRGVLCSPCNIKLGYWERELPKVVAAVAYLTRTREIAS